MKLLSALALCLAALASPARAADPATIPLPNLPPNARLAIWGDSITEVTLYPRFTEIYLLACAGRKDVTVCTFGHSGETQGGLISRQSDLDAFKPTVVSFNYGMNDTQYSPYTDAKGAAFDKITREVLALLLAKGIAQRIVVGPPAVNDNFNRDTPDQFFRGVPSNGLTAADAQNLTLGHFRDFARAAAVDTHSAFADIHVQMLDAHARAKKDLGLKYPLAAGGPVHPSPNGHLMIACELLKALACTGDLGTFDVDLKARATASTGHSVVSFAAGVLVLDSTRYPFCYGYDPSAGTAPDGVVAFAPYTSFTPRLNRFILKVVNLDAPSATVTWGSQTQSFTREALAHGINLAAHFPSTPFDSTFSHVMQAVADKQEFENYMIKGTSNYFGNDNGGNIDANMLAVHAQKDAALKALIVPVRHTIVITPLGAPETVPPVITGPLMAYATVGRPFTYQPHALHTPTTYLATSLPKDFTLNPATGEITGTPTAPGTHTITLSATNPFGKSSATLTLLVTPALPDRPQLTSPEPAVATVGVPFSYQITATNKPDHFFVTTPSNKGTVPPASSLPAGLSYNAATGLLSGTPATPGKFPLQLAAINHAGVATKLVTLTINNK